MGDQLSCTFCQFQVFVKEVKSCSIRNGQSPGEVVDPNSFVSVDNILAFLDFVLTSGSLGLATPLQI